MQLTLKNQDMVRNCLENAFDMQKCQQFDNETKKVNLATMTIMMH